MRIKNAQPQQLAGDDDEATQPPATDGETVEGKGFYGTNGETEEKN
ncbi:hypothetical protein [Miniimonas sp. S16]|nr:hypothetical protein [Miniimonas sp. S16]